MSLYAPDEPGIWGKASATCMFCNRFEKLFLKSHPFPLVFNILSDQAKLRITQGIQQQGGTSLVSLGAEVTHVLRYMNPL